MLKVESRKFPGGQIGALVSPHVQVSASLSRARQLAVFHERASRLGWSQRLSLVGPPIVHVVPGTPDGRSCDCSLVRHSFPQHLLRPVRVPVPFNLEHLECSLQPIPPGCFTKKLSEA